MTSNKVVHAIGVKQLPTKSLKPNPHNPRLLFDRADMDILRSSIERVGILVPLTVYRESRSGVYRILDGQRRWICAQEAGLTEIPVNEVSEPSLVQNIVTMFQIHKLRKDWELMPTALKLELLMRELKEKGEKRLAALTGLDEAVVVRCKKLLSYPKKYQDMMLDPDPENRAKADFFIELYVVVTDRNVIKFDWFSRNRFTDAMLKKADAKALHSVTEFRIVKQHINNAAKAKKLPVISNRPGMRSDAGIFLEFVQFEQLHDVPRIILRLDHAALQAVIHAREIHRVDIGAKRFEEVLIFWRSRNADLQALEIRGRADRSPLRCDLVHAVLETSARNGIDALGADFIAEIGAERSIERSVNLSRVAKAVRGRLNVGGGHKPG